MFRAALSHLSLNDSTLLSIQLSFDRIIFFLPIVQLLHPQ